MSPLSRALPLLLCLSFGACAGGVSLPNAELPSAAAGTPPPAAAPQTAAAPAAPPQRSGRSTTSGASGGARGGSITAAATAPAEPLDPGVDPLTQARADCWVKVEANRALRGNVDQRAAFVDKCVADRMKGVP